MTQSAPKKAKKESPKFCPNMGAPHIINVRTGELVQLPCKRYACPYCGPKKAYKLRKCLENKFESYDFMRLFTFTFRTSIFVNEKHAIRRSSEVWRRFINNIRRDKTLHHSLRDFQYIKLCEFTKAGYPHYHVLIDRYLPIQIVANHWRHAINVVCHNTGYNGTVHVKGILNSKNASRYVVKYVLKTAKDFDIFLNKFFEFKRAKLKLYTKSKLMKIFYESCSIDPWEFIYLYEMNPNFNLTCKPIAQLPKDIELFSTFIPPPSDKFIQIQNEISTRKEKERNQLEIIFFELNFN